MTRNLMRSLIAFLLLQTALLAHAQLRVEISGVSSNQIPIAVAIFADDALSGESISNIIKADLKRSGVFRLVETAEVLSETPSPDMTEWKNKGIEALVVGSVTRLNDGRFELRYKLMDPAKETSRSSLSLIVRPTVIRMGAHRISDDVYEKLTGTPGAFATRIAYILRADAEYRLEIADSDGENPIIAVRSAEPIISPVWSPDGSKLAYVSFENKKPMVFVQDLASRQRLLVANFKGSNSAPAWSPDGQKLALALSRDGYTQIYSINADGTDLKRLSNSNGIDTEPRFSPDGRSIYFTSDRSGGPQTYRMSAEGGDAKRVTFNGTYNISPRISPDGKMMAYISRREGRFQLYTLDFASAQELRLSDNGRDESPSFSPNGRFIMHASGPATAGTLAVVSVDGRTRYKLTARNGTVREPTWGPFIK